MAFSNNFRMERVYFEKLKGQIDILKSYLDNENDEKIKSMLKNGVDADGAILLLYRNLGEAWAELSELIKKADEKIEQTKEAADKYHDELNERIDEVNNYLMALIRELQAKKHLHIAASYNIVGNYIIFYNQPAVIFNAIHEAVGDITNLWADYQYNPFAFSITVDIEGKNYVARYVGYTYGADVTKHAYMFEFDYLHAINGWTKVRFWVYADRVEIK